MMSNKKPKNKYLKNARITEAEFRSLLRCLALDLTALQTAQISGLHRNTVNRIFHLSRQKMAAFCEDQSPLNGAIEVDESYFGPRRVRGKRGRGAGSKTIVFGLLKREGKVYTQLVPNASKATLQAIIRGKITLDSVIYSDAWRAYDGLVDVGFDKHLRVKHGENEFVETGNPTNHINGIESFWRPPRGRLPNGGWLNSTASVGDDFICFSKNVNSVSTTAISRSIGHYFLCF